MVEEVDVHNAGANAGRQHYANDADADSGAGKMTCTWRARHNPASCDASARVAVIRGDALVVSGRLDMHHTSTLEK